jgi:signal transduction histidine kinase
VTRAHKLVQDFKKVSVDQITDSKEQVDLAEVVAEIAHLFRVTARESRMDVVVTNTLPGARGEWLGYPGALSQVLLNVLSNAQRYAYAEGVGGTVEITLTLEGTGEAPGYSITIRDFGKGIPPLHLPRVFEPFFTTGRGKGGSGLGMAIVYNLVTVQLHGSVEIASSVGEGTTVTLRLPATVPE